MSKRTSDEISLAEDSTDNNLSIPDVVAVPILPPHKQHFIEQTFLGPICTKCDRAVDPKNTLFSITKKTLLTHWNKCKCFTGGKPNASQLERDLRTQIIGIHSRIANTSLTLDAMVNEHLPPATTNIIKTGFCSRCGYSGKPSNVRRHLTSTKITCNILDFNQQGDIYKTKHGFRVPKAILLQMAAGKFKLPFVQSSSSSSNNTNNSLPTIAAAATALPTTPTATPPTIFDASPVEMAAVCAEHHENSASVEEGFVLQELECCFGSDAMVAARGHMSTFLHLTKGSQSLPPKLIDMNKKLTLDDASINFSLLLQSSKKWLKSGAANMDVGHLSADVRNRVYTIGTCVAQSDRDLFRGSTFVATDDMKFVVPELESLLLFASNMNYTRMTSHKVQAMRVYESVPYSENETEDERDQKAYSRILDSNIIPGLLVTILLEPPRFPNGPNLISDYLAACSVKVDHQNHISFRNPNEISKKANALLRLLRHGVCSTIRRKATDMDASGESDNQFRQWTDQFLEQVQTCLSTDEICRRIRSAREVGIKLGTSVEKSFDFRTGEIYVTGIRVQKSVWSQSIPTALSEWDSILHSFFNCRDTIDKVFNIKNTCVLAGNQSKIIVSDGPGNDEEILFNDIVPLFTGNIENIKKAIQMCWTNDKGSHAYFGSGAARGAEVTRLLPFDESQYIFGSLRYEMFSKKNEKHGVKENKSVTHWLPPSVTRRILLQNLVLYPAIDASPIYSLPSNDKAKDAANDFFGKVMGMEKPPGTKIARDLMAMITNYIDPKSLSNISTSIKSAMQFHHSAGTWWYWCYTWG